METCLHQGYGSSVIEYVLWSAMDEWITHANRGGLVCAVQLRMLLRDPLSADDAAGTTPLNSPEPKRQRRE